MKKTLPANVTKKKIKGADYFYYRQMIDGKEQYTRLPSNPDSQEFSAAYWRIRSGLHEPVVAKTSWDNLIIKYLASPKYTKKKPGTKRKYRPVIESIRETSGRRDITATRRSDIMAIQEKYAETPRKADHYVQVIRILFNFAIKLEWTTYNPANGIELFGTQRPFEAWPQSEQRSFVNLCKQRGAMAALAAYYLGTGTGQRPGDLCRMKWEHIEGEYMSVLQEKTRNRVLVYCPQSLRDNLATIPKAGAFILAKNLHAPLGYDAVEKQFRTIRDELKTEKRLTMHGWRYTAALELAEAGCSDAQIQAVTGHKTLEMVQKYRAEAETKKLSKQAQILREQNKDRT